MDALLENEDDFKKLRSALAGLCKTTPGSLPPAKTVSYKLRSLNGKVGHGMIFSRNPGGERLWYVRSKNGGPVVIPDQKVEPNPSLRLVIDNTMVEDVMAMV
jgi:hypothetical protein